MKVSIIALGRLGRKFYEWADSKHEVIGTYNTTIKENYKSVQYDFLNSNLPNDIQNSDILLFNLTPSAIQSVTFFKSFLDEIKTKKLIFVTSTSVYGMQGEVDEDTTPIPETDSGKLLYECEKELTMRDLNSVIIRPSGIITDSSHPGNYLAGREVNINGQSSVNMIHIDDLLSIVVKSLEVEYKIINATNTNHPKKADYYYKYSLDNNLKEPTFLKNNLSLDKIITTKYKDMEINTALK